MFDIAKKVFVAYFITFSKLLFRPHVVRGLGCCVGMTLGGMLSKTISGGAGTFFQSSF